MTFCRCHTFGIGSEVCVELVTGIAAFSCGKCVLLKEGERLQTKVHHKIYLYKMYMYMYSTYRMSILSLLCLWIYVHVIQGCG